MSSPSIVVVMPAYNAALTLRRDRGPIPSDLVAKVILVDDDSRDDTVPVARELGVEVIAHPHNVGYGGNQKTCYMAALRQGADVVVMLHPDGQYDPALLPAMVEPIINGEADIILGSRFCDPGGARAAACPCTSIVSNRFLTTVENYVLGTHFSELHTGYRAYSREFLETIPFLRNSNDFVFDTQVIAQAVAFDQRVTEVPIDDQVLPGGILDDAQAERRLRLKTLAVMLRYRLHATAVSKAAIFLP